MRKLLLLLLATIAALALMFALHAVNTYVIRPELFLVYRPFLYLFHGLLWLAALAWLAARAAYRLWEDPALGDLCAMPLLPGRFLGEALSRHWLDSLYTVVPFTLLAAPVIYDLQMPSRVLILLPVVMAMQTLPLAALSAWIALLAPGRPGRVARMVLYLLGALGVGVMLLGNLLGGMAQELMLRLTIRLLEPASLDWLRWWPGGWAVQLCGQLAEGDSTRVLFLSLLLPGSAVLALGLMMWLQPRLYTWEKVAGFHHGRIEPMFPVPSPESLPAWTRYLLARIAPSRRGALVLLTADESFPAWEEGLISAGLAAGAGMMMVIYLALEIGQGGSPAARLGVLVLPLLCMGWSLGRMRLLPVGLFHPDVNRGDECRPITATLPISYYQVVGVALSATAAGLLVSLLLALPLLVWVMAAGSGWMMGWLLIQLFSLLLCFTGLAVPFHFHRCMRYYRGNHWWSTLGRTLEFLAVFVIGAMVSIGLAALLAWGSRWGQIPPLAAGLAALAGPLLFTCGYILWVGGRLDRGRVDLDSSIE